MINKEADNGKIFIITGPSGSGKTTLRNILLKDKKLANKFTKSVSLTTRRPRHKEKNGKDYFFISKAEFTKQKRDKKILEWTKYLGYYYATPRNFVEAKLRQGKNVSLCLDLKGALRLKRLYPKKVVAIFILQPSLETLRKRIEGRCNKTKRGEIIKRLRLAKKELLFAKDFDYSILNTNLKQAELGLKKIILKELQ